MKLNDIRPNPSNPRFIKDDKFKKLVASIKDFPKMMELRPIVVDTDMIILGGNMRYRALQEAKYVDLPDTWVKVAKDLTEDEKKRFIIEDNVSFGNWDFDLLGNNFEIQDLSDWGFDDYLLKTENTIDFEKEWEGMPEFKKESLDAYKMLIVRFSNKKDYEDFAKLINQSLTEKTKYIRYPEQDLGQTGKGLMFDK